MNIPKRRLYEKYVEKIQAFNENIIIDAEDWNSSTRQVKCSCKIHGGSFIVYKDRTNLVNNCPQCKKKYTTDELDKIHKKCDEIDEKYKQIKYEDDKQKVEIKEKEKIEIKKKKNVDKEDIEIDAILAKYDIDVTKFHKILDENKLKVIRVN